MELDIATGHSGFEVGDMLVEALTPFPILVRSYGRGSQTT
jgi:hypothetical protein